MTSLYIGLDIKKPIVCKDGFKMSIQASEYHYCKPQVTGLAFYEQYEVSCEPQTILKEYDSGGVYGHVPASVVADVIRDHGGIKVSDGEGQ